jgi:acetyltransferase-like isoleucine patch superfamily enzyme
VIKRAWLKFQKAYARHFIAPQMARLGKGFIFMRPWHVKLFGGPIEIGRWATFIATADKKIRFSVWPDSVGQGRIKLGDYVLICPGVRISSAIDIQIDDNCMLANNAYITDSDWHGIYDRLSYGRAKPIAIEKNVWIGDSAIVCKGVSIGTNSIIGAGAVVIHSIPANVIAAGNPAKVVKKLDPNEKITTRSEWFADPARLDREFIRWEQAVLRENTLFGWLRHLFFPSRGD